MYAWKLQSLSIFVKFFVKFIINYNVNHYYHFFREINFKNNFSIYPKNLVWVFDASNRLPHSIRKLSKKLRPPENHQEPPDRSISQTTPPTRSKKSQWNRRQNRIFSKDPLPETLENLKNLSKDLIFKNLKNHNFFGKINGQEFLRDGTSVGKTDINRYLGWLWVKYAGRQWIYPTAIIAEG